MPVLAGKNEHRFVLFAGKSEHHLDPVNTCFTPMNFYVHGSQVKVHPGARACGFRFRHKHTYTHTHTDKTNCKYRYTCTLTCIKRKKKLFHQNSFMWGLQPFLLQKGVEHLTSTEFNSLPSVCCHDRGCWGRNSRH